ncbi:MAG TPA: metal-dependent transcriptional regulator [Candidatus Excrementavichristensenella intestinipullorum]|nr:metal-dependent transcriptional regulator [Candidatus Excrementavichristensenella intestinipullorum]
MKVQESRENYLEAILVLSKQGQVRSIDVANYLEFSKPSVSVAVANLKAALLLTVDENGHLHLTESGRALAEQVYERHTLLTECLVRLGVDPRIAAEDACRMEHVISQESFEQIKAHMGKGQK